MATCTKQYHHCTPTLGQTSNIGISLNDTTFLNILLYADDIILLACNEEDLQSLLFIVENWCKRWRLEINLTKTNIMHVRGVRKKQSNFMFLFDKRPIMYCRDYKYLGANVNEFLDFNFTAGCLADSAGRALSSIITKMIKNGGFPYKVYSILYDSCVTSISDYCGEVIGYDQHPATLAVHTRAIRAFIGLPKNTCSVGVLSEVDWLLPQYRTRVRMVRMFNRIVKMSENRLTKKVFLWDKNLNDSNQMSSWSSEIKSIFSDCNMLHIYDNCSPFNVKSTTTEMQLLFKIQQQNYLKAECQTKPKLRTFIKIKNFSEIPAYIVKPLSFVQRRHIGKTRLGSLQIRLETGRYSRPVLEEHLRTCLVCVQGNHEGHQDQVENEHHFIFICRTYANLRREWLEKITVPDNFDNLEQCEQLSIVLNHPDNVKLTSQFVISAFDMRSKVINK